MPRLFATHYDTLYQEKNYGGEAKQVCDLLKADYRAPKTLLEIGSGTGGHTEWLSKSFGRIWAVDCDPEMVAIAREKGIGQNLTNVTWIQNAIENTVLQSPAEAACALFNVTNYLADESSLHAAWSHLRTLVKPKARFVFDCWNGIHALRGDPFRQEIRRFDLQDNQLTVTIDTRIEFMRQMCTLDYHLTEFSEKEPICHQTESIRIRLWTLQEIQRILESCGWTLERVLNKHTPGQAPTETTKNLLLVAHSDHA